MIFLTRKLVFVKKSLDNGVWTGAWRWLLLATVLLLPLCYQARPKPVGRIAKTFFPRAKFTRQVFCSFFSSLRAGNLVNIRSTQKLSWISLFHARGRRMPSFWVTGTTRFESVDIICQIWPIRGYTRSWYTGTGCLKKWLQAPPPLLSPVSSCFTFIFALSQFSGPNYLGAWNRLCRRLQVWFKDLRKDHIKWQPDSI